MDMMFYITSVVLGVGLAMDAFTVSIANGISNARTGVGTALKVTAVYAAFQFAMPMLGWFFVHTAAKAFREFNGFIPWIALILLAFLGLRMIADGLKDKKFAGHNSENSEKAGCVLRDNKKADLDTISDTSNKGVANNGLTAFTLIMQGIATSIDALSTGFAITDYDVSMALVCSLIIAVVTWLLCICGIYIGKKVGGVFSANATIIGGIILVFIGIEVFAKGVLL